MKNLLLTFCLAIATLLASVGGGFASDLPNCPASGYFDNCFGTYTFSVGHRYVGDWNDNKQDGRGIETWASGKKYVGEFRDGKRNGQGTFNFASGNKYVGEYKNGKKDGQGTYTWTYGDKYAGEYKDGKRNGQGTYTYANGTIEEGFWEDGKFQYAQKLSPQVQVTEAPTDDEIISLSSESDLPECINSAKVWHDCFGNLLYENGDKYVGDFEENKKHGHGTYDWANGDKYVGEFKKDMQNGLGVYTQSDGTIEDGIYLDDELLYIPSLIIRWFRGVKG